MIMMSGRYDIALDKGEATLLMPPDIAYGSLSGVPHVIVPA